MSLSRFRVLAALRTGTGDVDVEVISMGLEYIYADPVGLSLNDPRLFDYTLDVVMRT